MVCEIELQIRESRASWVTLRSLTFTLSKERVDGLGETRGKASQVNVVKVWLRKIGSWPMYHIILKCICIFKQNTDTRNNPSILLGLSLLNTIVVIILL